MQVRYEKYPDELTVALMGASAKAIGCSIGNFYCKIFLCSVKSVLYIDDVLELFGDYFMAYVRDEGYLNLLSALGQNLREWLTNVNDLHGNAHLIQYLYFLLIINSIFRAFTTFFTTSNIS